MSKAGAQFLLWLIVVLALCFLLSGCSLLPQKWFKKSVATPTVTVEHGVIKTEGDAKTPAVVKQSTTEARVELPPGSELTFNATLNEYSIHVPKASSFVSHTEKTDTTGPTAFTPPAPPTPTEVAKGETVRWFYLAIAAGTAAFIFGLVEQFKLLMIGGGVAVGGALVGIFFAEHPTVSLVLIVVGAVLAVTGPTVWHLVIKPKTP